MTSHIYENLDKLKQFASSQFDGAPVKTIICVVQLTHMSRLWSVIEWKESILLLQERMMILRQCV